MTSSFCLFWQLDAKKNLFFKKEEIGAVSRNFKNVNERRWIFYFFGSLTEVDLYCRPNSVWKPKKIKKYIFDPILPIIFILGTTCFLTFTNARMQCWDGFVIKAKTVWAVKISWDWSCMLKKGKNVFVSVHQKSISE